jgi:hypothetical protein
MLVLLFFCAVADAAANGSAAKANVEPEKRRAVGKG